MASDGEVVDVVVQASTPCRLVSWKVQGDCPEVVLDQPLAVLEPLEGESSKHLVVKSRCRVGLLTKFASEGETVQPKEVIGSVRFQCNHEVVVNGLCSICSAIISKTQGQASCGTYMPVVHYARNVVASEKAARDMAEVEKQRLLRSKKLVLVVDLDQTLIHTSMDYRIQPGVEDVYGFDMLESNRKRVLYHVRLRPHTRAFLQALRSQYEMHVFTMGSRRYAESIAELLENEVPSEKGQSLFSRRILSRDELLDHRSKAPNLRALFAANDSMVVIIDDRIDVWENQANVVQVQAYRFWKDVGDINLPSGASDHRHAHPYHARHPPHPSSAPHQPPLPRQPATSAESSHSPVAAVADTRPRSEQTPAGEASHVSSASEMPPRTDEDVNASKSVPDSHPTQNAGNGPQLEPSCEALRDSVSTERENAAEGSASGGASESSSSSSSSSDDDADDGDDAVDGLCKVAGGAEEGSAAAVAEEEPTDGTQSNVGSSDEKLASSGDSDDSLSSAFGKAGQQELEPMPKEEDLAAVSENSASSATGEPAAASMFVDHDDYLLHLTSILHRVHKLFFAIKEANPTALPCTRQLLPELRSQTLRDVRIVFSGVIPTDFPFPEQHEAWRTALLLGATVQVSLSANPTHPTTHLVAAKYGTHKVHSAQRMRNVSVVTTEWLWSCSHKWMHAKEEDFPLLHDHTGIEFSRSAHSGKRPRRPGHRAGHQSTNLPHPSSHPPHSHRPVEPRARVPPSVAAAAAGKSDREEAALITRQLSISAEHRSALLEEVDAELTTDSGSEESVPGDEVENKANSLPSQAATAAEPSSVSSRKRRRSDSDSSGPSSAGVRSDDEKSSSPASSLSNDDNTTQSSDDSYSQMASLLDREIAD